MQYQGKKLMNLGKKIKEARENKGFTQIDLANDTQISRASIQLYEANKVNIPFKNLEKIAKSLDIDLDYFLSNKMSISQKNLSLSQDDNLSLSVPKSPLSQNKNTQLTNLQVKQLQNDQIYITSLTS